MNRKQFIYAISFLTLVPVFDYEWKSYYSDPLSEPTNLSKFCSFNELKLIGKKYLELKPEEYSKNKLTDLLFPKKYTHDWIGNNKSVRKWIENEIKNDFENSNTFLLNGWVISQTEARQCALTSLL